MPKPSVMIDLPDWVGWEVMNEYLETAKRSKFSDDSVPYLITLFETGCRREEAVTIRKSQVKYNNETIVIKRVPVTKYRSAMVRDVMILRDHLNPWSEPFIEYVENLEHEYLFPARKKKSREIIEDKYTTGRTVYNRISEIDSSLILEDRDMWCHGLRGLRASMLVAERNFQVQVLMKWFEWKHPSMALHYTRTRDLAKAMGIENIPT